MSEKIRDRHTKTAGRTTWEDGDKFKVKICPKKCPCHYEDFNHGYFSGTYARQIVLYAEMNKTVPQTKNKRLHNATFAFRLKASCLPRGLQRLLEELELIQK